MAALATVLPSQSCSFVSSMGASKVNIKQVHRINLATQLQSSIAKMIKSEAEESDSILYHQSTDLLKQQLRALKDFLT